MQLQFCTVHTEPVIKEPTSEVTRSEERRVEEQKHVGQTEVVETWNWFCPHILGGINTRVLGVVTSVYEMQHGAEGKFLSISGLTDDKI